MFTLKYANGATREVDAATLLYMLDFEDCDALETVRTVTLSETGEPCELRGAWHDPHDAMSLKVTANGRVVATGRASDH